MAFEAATITKPARKKFSQLKDKDEQRFMVMDAVSAFKRMPELKREIKAFKADKELMTAVRAALKNEVDDSKQAATSAK